MKIKQIAFFIVVTTIFSTTAYSKPLVYEESRDGSYFYMNPLSEKPETAEAHWEYATSLREMGKTEKARKQFKIFVKRWPENVHAPAAQRAVGDLYFSEGKDLKAFKAYEALIRSYYTGLKSYDIILENQYTIAQNEMKRKRMRWFAGGYTAPTRAIPLLESILRNAPQWDRAPELQYQIGEAYQTDGDEEMAVVAYTTVEYRYPESPFAERAGFEKIKSFQELVRTTPYSIDLREQAQVAAQIFVVTYPESSHVPVVNEFGAELKELAAQQDYDVASFYENIPKQPRKESARIYYNKVVQEHEGSEIAVRATERLAVLSSTPEELVAGSTPLAGSFVQGDVEEWPLPEVLSDDPDAVDVSADRLEYEGDLLIGEGNVAVQQDGASLQADRVVVNQTSGDITAEGNVVMFREGLRWDGEKLIYNYKTRDGTFGHSAIYFDPAYIVAETTTRVSTNEFLLTNARITTCAGDNPVIYAKAKEVTILDEDKESGTFIQARDVTFYVKDVPVFYLPRWQRHLGYRVFTYTVGYGGRLGFFFRGSAELHPTDWLLARTHLDLYSSRGIGIGQDFKWKVRDQNGDLITEKGSGQLETYYINDKSPYESTETPAEKAAVDSSRYRIKLKHNQDLTDKTYFSMEMNYQSDPFVINDFFSEEFRRNANPENYAVIQHVNDEFAASLRVDRSLNDFYTTVDRFPELNFDWYRAQIGDSKFYFESESSLAFLEKIYGEIDPNSTFSLSAPFSNPSDYNSARFDTYNKVLMPLRFKDYLNVIPRVAYRGTWYGDTIGGSADLRNIVEFGTLTTYKTYKTLSTTSGFYGDGLHHVLQPYADYNYRPEPSIKPDEIYQFDELDALDKENVVRFGARNFIQTKRDEDRIVNFLDANLFTSLRLEKTGDQDDFGPLEGDLELSLTDFLNIQSDFEFDWYDTELDVFNARIRYVTEDHSEYAFEYRYLRDERMLFTPYMRLFPNEKWSYEMYMQYDVEYGEWFDRSFIVNRKFDCVSMGVGVRVDSDNEPTLWFQLWLNAFPESGFGTQRD